MFEEFGQGRAVTPAPFPRITYAEAVLEYGTDKPDLRNPLVIADVSEVFAGSGFRAFARIVERGRRRAGDPGAGVGVAAPLLVSRQAGRLGESRDGRGRASATSSSSVARRAPSRWARPDRQ